MGSTEEVIYKCSDCWTTCTIIIDSDDDVVVLANQICIQDLETGGANWVLQKES